jgi:hypothetical protein
MKNGINLDAMEDENFSRSGIYGLWLQVTCEACKNFIRYRGTLAESFLFDRDNQFFDMVADQLNFEPDALRKGIRHEFRRRQRVTAKTYDIN